MSRMWAHPRGETWARTLGLDGQAGVVPLSDRFAEVGGIAANDDGGEEVELGYTAVLALAR